MSDDKMIMCIGCRVEVLAPGNVWPDGWGCLYGNLAVCSRECAAAWAGERFKPEDVEETNGTLREERLRVDP